jgi:undecaprenyl-diphosphatase
VNKILGSMKKNLELRKADNQLFFIYIILLFSLSWLTIFLVFIEDSLELGGGNLDKQAITYVLSVRNPQMTTFFSRLTSLENFIPMLIITSIIVLAFYYFNKKGEAVFFGINIICVWLLNELLKQIFRRPRPQGIQLIKAADFSFPSGHAMISMASVLLLIYFVIRFIKNKKLAYLLSIILFIYALLIGISRIYLGVHYLSDVLVGWLIAGIWVFINIEIYKHKLCVPNLDMKER